MIYVITGITYINKLMRGEFIINELMQCSKEIQYSINKAFSEIMVDQYIYQKMKTLFQIIPIKYFLDMDIQTYNDTYNINTTNTSNYTSEQIKFMEDDMYGCVSSDYKIIYISSTIFGYELLHTIIHEMCHIINKNTYTTFSDEYCSYIHEIYLTNPFRPITRSINKILTKNINKQYNTSSIYTDITTNMMALI